MGFIAILLARTVDDRRVSIDAILTARLRAWVDVTRVSAVDQVCDTLNSAKAVVVECLFRAGKILDCVWLRCLFPGYRAEVVLIASACSVTVRVSHHCRVSERGRTSRIERRAIC